jgi:hypothetical protein
MDIEILITPRLNEWGMRLKYPPEAIEALQATAGQIVGDPELLATLTEYHQHTALHGEWAQRVVGFARRRGREGPPGRAYIAVLSAGLHGDPALHLM